MPEIEKHKRVNDILLGPLERPALKWLAAHMPAWITPDRCTAIGVLGAVMTMLGYILSNLNPLYLWLATLGFVVNWLGDSLDGTLARYRGIERPVYGFFIDHTTDAAGQVMIFLGLGMSPYVRFDVAALTLIAYFLLSVLVYVRTCVMGEFRISYGRLGPTEVRVMAIMLNTAMLIFGERSFVIPMGSMGGFTFSTYDLFVAFIALLLVYFFITTALRETRNLIKANK